MKIICIGRNYVEHAKELNNSLPNKPVFFLKPDTSLLLNNKPFFYPNFTNNLHYELEVVIRIGRLGKCIEERFAYRYIDSIGLGIDFTARDLQDDCKTKGLPWEPAKAFDSSAPISNFIPIADFKDPNNIEFYLNINNKLVQKGNTSDMIFPFNKIIAYVSQFITLKIGDFIFTGTPQGVGQVHINDHLEGYLNGNKMLDFYIK